MVNARSALPSSSKRAILVAEAVRRLKNCSTSLPIEEVAGYISTFNLAMRSSGHSERFRTVVNKRAMAIYNNSCTLSREQGRPMWRSREERREQVRESGGKNSKTDWFTKLGYQNTMTVPASKDGELMEKVSKVLSESMAPMGFRTLVMEDGGRAIKTDMVRTNPFPPIGGCGRDLCMMCKVKPSKGRCWDSNIVYSITCNRSPCTEGGIIPTYIGETCRSTKTRGSQHLTLYKGKKDNSFLWKHTQEEHQGQIGEADYKMEPLSRCKDSFTRIIQEAVLIQKNESDPKTDNLNSKMEYFGAEYIRPTFSKGPADLW